MSRVRISTTVDAARLARARALTGVRDSELFDRALLALARDETIQRELAALERFPYSQDPELQMPGPPADARNELDFAGAVPARVRAAATRRRAARR
jgi:hypothetical protein